MSEAKIGLVDGVTWKILVDLKTNFKVEFELFGNGTCQAHAKGIRNDFKSLMTAVIINDKGKKRQ